MSVEYPRYKRKRYSAAYILKHIVPVTLLLRQGASEIIVTHKGEDVARLLPLDYPPADTAPFEPAPPTAAQRAAFAAAHPGYEWPRDMDGTEYMADENGQPIDPYL